MSAFRTKRLDGQTGSPAAGPGAVPGGGYDSPAIRIQPREVTSPERFPQSPLRYRRFGGGYRADDVELVLAECRLAVRQLERRVAPLRDRERELQAEVDALRREVDTLRTSQAELGGQVEAALSHAAKVERLARDQSLLAVRASADEDPQPEWAPGAAAMSGKPLTELARINEELLASAQTLDAQLRHVDETLRGQPSRRPEPEPADEAPAPVEPEPEAGPVLVEPEPERREEPERIRVRPQVAYDELPPERPAAPIVAETLPRRRAAGEVLALREELSALEQRRARAAARGTYAPALVIGLVAAGLATAVGLAVAGYGTAAVILLAAYALAIAAVSVYGPPVGMAVRPEPTPTPFGPLRPAHSPVQDRLVPAGADELRAEREPEPEPEPVAVFDAAQAQRELAQLARERARRLVELGDAVESGDDDAAAQARARLRELDGLIASKEAELEAEASGNGGYGAAQNGEAWSGRPVGAESHSEL
jgi:hypothetical protein